MQPRASVSKVRTFGHSLPFDERDQPNSAFSPEKFASVEELHHVRMYYWGWRPLDALSAAIFELETPENALPAAKDALKYIHDESGGTLSRWISKREQVTRYL